MRFPCQIWERIIKDLTAWKLLDKKITEVPPSASINKAPYLLIHTEQTWNVLIKKTKRQPKKLEESGVMNESALPKALCMSPFLFACRLSLPLQPSN